MNNISILIFLGGMMSGIIGFVIGKTLFDKVILKKERILVPAKFGDGTSGFRIIRENVFGKNVEVDILSWSDASELKRFAEILIHTSEHTIEELKEEDPNWKPF